MAEPGATAQRPWLSRIVQTHNPRQPQSWLTCNVRQNMNLNAKVWRYEDGEAGMRQFDAAFAVVTSDEFEASAKLCLPIASGDDVELTATVLKSAPIVNIVFSKHGALLADLGFALSGYHHAVLRLDSGYHISAFVTP